MPIIAGPENCGLIPRDVVICFYHVVCKCWFFALSSCDSLLVFAFSCYEFSLRFANVTLAAISTWNVINRITSIFFIHLVFRFWKHLANCLIGFKCHFDAMVFQNSLNWLRGPANVWNCAVPPYRFRMGGCIFHRWFKVAVIQDEALGSSIGLQCRYYSLSLSILLNRADGALLPKEYLHLTLANKKKWHISWILISVWFITVLLHNFSFTSPEEGPWLRPKRWEHFYCK